MRNQAEIYPSTSPSSAFHRPGNSSPWLGSCLGVPDPRFHADLQNRRIPRVHPQAM